MTAMKRVIHTIPVHHGMSIEQCWERIKREDWLPNVQPMGWANIETIDGKFVRVLPVDAQDESQGSGQ